jgi:hypothetical protein
MWNKIKKIILFLFVICGNCLAQTDSLKDILATAKVGYSEYIEKIPEGKELFFGFNNRDEFTQVNIGKAYLVYALSNEFFNENFLTDKNYIKPTGEWLVSLTVKGESRVLITITKMNGELKVVSIGAAVLAGELGEFEKEYPSENQVGMLLRVYQLSCDFFINPSVNLSKESKIYPLNSAKIGLSLNNDNTNSSYSVNQVLSLVKNKLNK